MLDRFVEVLVEREKKAQVTDEITEMLKKLPVDEISKVACGDVPSGKTWLTKYEGTPLYDQAVALEESKLQLEAKSIERRMQRSQERAQERMQEAAEPDTYDQKDMIRLKQRLLDLDLSKQNLTGGAPAPVEEAEEDEGEVAPDINGPEQVPMEATASANFVRDMAKEAQGEQAYYPQEQQYYPQEQQQYYPQEQEYQGYDPRLYGLGGAALGAAAGIPFGGMGIDTGLAGGLGAYYGAKRGGPVGRAGEGAARGGGGAAAGTVGGGALGMLGGGALGAGAGYGLSKLLGMDPLSGAGVGGAVGGGAGLLGGAILGGRKGYDLATRGLDQPKQAEVTDPAGIAKAVHALSAKTAGVKLVKEPKPPAPKKDWTVTEGPSTLKIFPRKGKKKEGCGTKTAEAIVSEYLEKQGEREQYNLAQGGMIPADMRPPTKAPTSSPEAFMPKFKGTSSSPRFSHAIDSGTKEPFLRESPTHGGGEPQKFPGAGNVPIERSPDVFWDRPRDTDVPRPPGTKSKTTSKTGSAIDLSKLAKKDKDEKPKKKGKPQVDTKWRPPSLPTPDYVGDADVYAKRLVNKAVHNVLRGMKKTETKAKRGARKVLGKEGSVQNVQVLFEKNGTALFSTMARGTSPPPKV